jgi:hypothetical protein
MRILRTLLAVICISLVASVASATTVVIPNIFSNGQVIDETMMNSNFSALSAWANGNVDNTNIGSGGIFASQIIPGSTAQATFGGATSYTFPTVLNLLGGAVVTGPASFSTLAANSPAVCTDSSRNLTTSGCGGGVTLYASQIIPTTTPQATFGGSVGYVFPTSVTHQAGASVAGGLTTDTLGVSGASNLAATTIVGGLTQSGGTVTVGTLNSTGVITGYGVNASTGKISGASDGATTTYLPPIYSHTGAAVPASLHCVQDALTFTAQSSATVNLSGAAPFSNISSYWVNAQLAGGYSFLPVATASGSQFTILSVSTTSGSPVNITGNVTYLACGT